MSSVVESQAQKCSRLLKHEMDGLNDQPYCKADFDRSLCWNYSQAGSFAYQPCPFEFCGFCDLPNTFASRYCHSNGTWAVTNYDACIEIWLYNRSCIATPCNPCRDYFKLTVRLVTFLLSFLSTACLLASFALFSAFKSLQCMRVSIHKNLCIALILRFSATAFWISLQWSGFFAGCLGFEPLKVDWLCKFILFCIMYSTSASAYWTLMEGVHLAGKISILALKSDIPCVFYTLIGWGVPLISVVTWGALMELNSGRRCWMPYSSSNYRWILIIPILTALLTNFILLLTIIIILVKKLNASYVREPHKLRKAAKAALLLAPLLGVTNLFFFIEPNDAGNLSHKIYIMGNAVMQHSQGIFLALIYCFFNSEMRQVVKRYWNMQRINGSPAKKRRKKTSMERNLGRVMITEVLLGPNLQLSKIIVTTKH